MCINLYFFSPLFIELVWAGEMVQWIITLVRQARLCQTGPTALVGSPRTQGGRRESAQEAEANSLSLRPDSSTQPVLKKQKQNLSSDLHTLASMHVYT